MVSSELSVTGDVQRKAGFPLVALLLMVGQISSSLIGVHRKLDVGDAPESTYFPGS